jgi:putative acetyltransferase
MEIRQELPEHALGVREVNERAFNGSVEADLVERLRERRGATLSLVAVEAGRVVGHIFFSPVTLESKGQTSVGVGLGPMAVLPEFQRQGIGTKLVETGLAQCRSAGFDFIVVLGHPEYYPRFGFIPASRFGLRSEYDVSDEVFMAMELRPNGLAGCAGVVRYQPEFNSV